MDDIDELNELLENLPASKVKTEEGIRDESSATIRDFLEEALPAYPRTHNDEPPFDDPGTLSQWTTPDGQRFIASGKSSKALPPGAYLPHLDSAGNMWFVNVELRTEGLLRFPETNIERVVEEIEKFWDREKRFAEYDITFKRGILLYGPPGSGKSSAIQLAMRDVIARNGVVLEFTYPSIFIEALRQFRAVQPDTPIVVLMEDLDSIIERYNESEVLNLLDGAQRVFKTVFLASTNHPERLGARIVNRPSRFDKRFKIGHPNDESRKLYLEFLCRKHVPEIVHIPQWVNDTHGFSLAHLKELFTSVVLMDNDYKDSLRILQKMKEKVSSAYDEEEFASPSNNGQYV